MLEIKEYSFEYIKNKKVVHHLNLQLHEGDIYAFVGKNGAGKSTTIKSLVGIYPLSEGDILLDGKSIKEDILSYKKQIAYIPDEPSLYENLTGMQYLHFIADLYFVSEKDREKKIKKYASLFEMEEHLSYFIHNYSHGMKQKLQLISAFIHNPKVYILDEPFSSLDPTAAYTLKQILKEEAFAGKIIFFSTHVLDVAEKIATNCAILKKGHLVKEGNLKEIIADKSLEDVFMELENE